MHKINIFEWMHKINMFEWMHKINIFEKKTPKIKNKTAANTFENIHSGKNVYSFVYTQI